MARAMEYRRMALTATSPEVQAALIKLAIRFVALATQCKLEARGAARLGRIKPPGKPTEA